MSHPEPGKAALPTSVFHETSGSVAPSPVGPDVPMEPAPRHFLCAVCGTAVLICSHCDRGQRYCGTDCADGNESYRRDVWIEGLRAGYAQDEITEYEPDATDLALVHALSLVPSAKPILRIKVPIAPSGGDGSQEKGAELAPPTSRKLRP